MTLCSETFQANALLIQAQLLQLSLSLSTATLSNLSTEPWEDYQPSDYASVNEYCSACLVDQNPFDHPKAYSQCWLPVIPPDGGPPNLNALRQAEAALLDQTSAVAIPLINNLRQKAATKLLDVMKFYELESDRKLADLAK